MTLLSQKSIDRIARGLLAAMTVHGPVARMDALDRLDAQDFIDPAVVARAREIVRNGR